MKLNKQNITKILTEIQNKGNWEANVIATKAIEDFGLEEEHTKQQKIALKKLDSEQKLK